jgi:DNA-binding transcriptional LysR family regulator
MEIGRSRERPRGRLRMHVGVGLGMHLIVPAMPRFFARYPEVDVDLWIEDRRVDLVRENMDISVYLTAPETTSLVVRKLFEFERVVCASPAYLKRHGTPRSPDDLGRYRCLSVSSVPDHSQWSFQTPTGARVIEMVPSAMVNNVEGVFRFALAGMGIVRLAEYVVADALRDGRLVEVLSDFHCPERLSVFMAYPPERHRLPRVGAMLEFLEKALANRPWREAKSKSKAG